jgi:hypothetical protein
MPSQSENLLLYIKATGRVGHPTYELIKWLDFYLRKHEQIEMFPWVDYKWYIEVKDERILAAARSADERIRAVRIGFTVDVVKDAIVWNFLGGNCFVRDRHWWKQFKARYPITSSDNPKGMEWSQTRTPNWKHISQYNYTPRIIRVAG